MSREIKFRAWDKKSARMVPWNEIYEQWGIEYLNDGLSDVMQYTGLKDKNGAEIFEGDIVRRWDELSYQVEFGQWENNGIYEDFERGYGWFLSNRAGDDMMLYPEETGVYEVIGNVWENEELIGDSK